MFLLLLLRDDLDLPTNLLCVIILKQTERSYRAKMCPPRQLEYNLHYDEIRTSPLPLSDRDMIDEMHCPNREVAPQRS